MAVFKIIFGNSAGELDRREAVTNNDAENGLQFEPFLDVLRDMLETTPLYDGDTIAIIVED